MSTTTTGNIKISQLSQLSTIDNGDKLRIPVSKDKSATSTPDWESYSVSASVLSSFFGINDLQNQSSKYNELEKKLGKYDLVSEITFYEGETSKYITTSGTKREITGSSYFISNEITLKQGNLYLLQENHIDYTSDALPADLALMAKVDKNVYRNPSGTTATDVVYEPLPNHYRTSDMGGYGIPTSRYYVFFATEDMNVVISGYRISKTLYEVKYGAFIEAASKLLTINGDLMKVIVEAIVKNKKDIDCINENMNYLGDIHANSIDLDDFPSVQGEPMVVVADRQPSEADTNHGDDVPNRIGQIWVDTTNKRAYIAVDLGSTGDASWKQITA